MKRTLHRGSEKQYTTEEKIKWVLKYLMHRIQPEICYTTKGLYSTGIEKKPKKKVSYFVCDFTLEDIPEEIPYPFEGVFVTINRKRITILGENFYYKFPPNFILTLFERFKETTK